MNRIQFVLRSLFYFARINLAVSLGVLAATAVLTGALLVGDSMRGSLRNISLDGLGKIDEILLSERFFRAELAAELEATDGFDEQFDRSEAIVIFPNASASMKVSADEKNVANEVTLIGCKNSFWDFSDDKIRPRGPNGVLPDFDNIDLSSTTVPVVINEPLASDLGVTRDDLSGDSETLLTVQIPKPQLINADNPIGKKEDLYETIARLKIVDILPAKSVGRLTLHPTQLLPRIVFAPLETVQEALQKEGGCNALIVSAKNAPFGTTPQQTRQLNDLLKPTSDDLGILFKEVRQFYPVRTGDQEEATTKDVFAYTSLSSEQLVLNDELVRVGKKAFADLTSQPILTYLANGIQWVDGEADSIPFSMVTAADWSDGFRLRSAVTGEVIGDLAEDEIVLNQWAATDLLLSAGKLTEGYSKSDLLDQWRTLIGELISVNFYEPEASHGKLNSRTRVFKLQDIAAITQPKTPFNRRRNAEFETSPTLANDPDLTPFVPGVTDQNSINKWDLPFKTEVRPQDDDYWQFYRTTPKAFVNLAVGQELWGSRFGKVTSLRIATTEVSPLELGERFTNAAAQENLNFGFQFTPIKRRNYQASSGSTPFDVLFLALSFFIIASALILIALLFRLGVEQKSQQLGLLSSVGLGQKQLSSLLLMEGLVISFWGSLAGVLVGVGYAKLMVFGLTTWWVGAVMTSFMEFHWTWQSLSIGFLVGIVVSLGTIGVTIRRIRRTTVRELLSGKFDPQIQVQRSDWGRLKLFTLGCFLLAVVLSVVAAISLGGEAQAGAFMGGGFLMLTALLSLVWMEFNRPTNPFGGLSATGLAVQNARRNPLRSTLTIGLVASATFLIVAVSSFHLTPSERGTGGFEFIGQSSRPVVGDFQDPLARQDLLGESLADLDDLEVFSLRLLPGDEAGCNNPFQAQRPKVLGVTQALIDRFNSRPDSDVGGFDWGGSIAASEPEEQNPWLLLDRETSDGSIPVVIDKNTAMYSLKIFGVGGLYEVEFDGGKKVSFKVAGLLSNSTLQGSLIVSEKNFVKLFPSVTGYRAFLISRHLDHSNPKVDDGVAQSQISKLENELSDYGLDVSKSMEVLSEFLAVQNTYLSTFQTLGAFGLLLGTFGLATVQLRNVVERRGELALMQAIGFSRGRVGQIVLAEHAVLLLSGMLIGLVAALFSVLPHLLFGDASVPLLLLSMVLVAILLTGLSSGLVAVRMSAKTPILSTLRADN